MYNIIICYRVHVSASNLDLMDFVLYYKYYKRVNIRKYIPSYMIDSPIQQSGVIIHI